MTLPVKHTIRILIGFSLLGACKQQEALPVLPADQVSLRLNESAQVNDITVRLDTLQGYGCPICLFAYNAFVSAVVSNTMEQQRVKLHLYSPSSRPDSTGVTLAGQTYKVILRDVTPHPSVDITSAQPGESRAVIQVTKL